MRTKIEERTAFPWSVKEPLLKETGGKCAHCGILLDRYTNLTIDHVIPLNKGGTNEQENLTVLCEDCNKLKSDMILPPVNWYPFLPVKRRKILGERLNRYIEETDYLSKDCLMPVDIFRVEVPITVKKKVSDNYRIIRMPAYIQGARMEYDAAFDWLMEYKRSLQWRDACGVLNHPSEFTAPCYLLKKGSIEVAMVNPWLIHEYDSSIGNYRNEILMDWFFSPSLPERDYLPEMLSYLILGTETYVTDSISLTMKGASTILFHTRCFLSDRFCASVFDKIAADRSDNIIQFDTGNSLTARIRDISVFHIVGDRKACYELRKKLDEKIRMVF